MARLTPRAVLAVVGVLAAAACSMRGPRPLAFGAEHCARCHMTLADPRFAAELLTGTGKVYPFDDVGCLAEFVAAGAVDSSRGLSPWVLDFTDSSLWLEASRAVFLLSDSLHTPMDHHVAAFASGTTADSVRARLGGSLVRWEDLLREARTP